MKAAVIIAAAGQGQRMGFKKQYLQLEGRPMFIRATEPFAELPFICQIIICVPQEDRGWVEEELLPPFSLLPQPQVISGGETRQETIGRALKQLKPEVEIVLIHDGARPFINRDLILEVFEGAQKKGAVIPGIPLQDTVKQVEDQNRVQKSLDRDNLRLIQTPQGFAREIIEEANAIAAREGWAVTDDAGLVEKAGYPVWVLPGEESNLKVTTRRDLELSPGDLRTGLGMDIHPLVPGRPLILGGIQIPWEKGCGGHSDGDALLHALMDSLLGAAGLEDIGHHFPDTDEKYRDACSVDLLKTVATLLREKGWQLNNADCTLVLEKPRIAPYNEKMKVKIAEALGGEKDRIGIKATTAEKMGFIGRGEGILAQVVVTIKRSLQEGGIGSEC